jgi:predicted MFS family arabinose efflux permease
LADRIGVRGVILGAMLLLGAAYAGLGLMTGGLWQYQALVLCLALTVPGTGALVYGKLIAAHFDAHRGFALAVGTSGLSLTTLALPPVIALVIAQWGWRGGFFALALATVLIALPIVLALIRRAPVAVVDPAEAPPLSGVTGAQARRTWSFWALGLAVALVNVATVGLITQMVPFGMDRGLTEAQAALLLTSYGAAQIAGALFDGLAGRPFPRPTHGGAIAAISTLGFLGLQLPAPGLALALALVFAAG